MQEKITLSGVPETMLQTVYARARESSGRGAIRDPKAEELIGRLDYDFSPAEKDAPMRSGVIARTVVLDQLVGKWLAAHPGAVVETMNPMVVKRFREKSIDASHARFTWGVKNGAALAALLPDFRLVEEHSLTEGMAAFVPIYKVLDKLPAVRNISNKIIVLERA